MSDKMTEEQLASPEEQERMNSREHLIRAAMWSGFANQEKMIADLQSGIRPWVLEFAPLTVDERVYVMALLCKQWFPEMDKEREAAAMRLLCRMYGVKRTSRMERRHVH